MKRIDAGLRPPSLPDCEVPALAAPPDGLDDATLAYVTETRVPFDMLRQAAGQIAGVLVLAVSAQRGAAGHPMLDLANAARTEANDLLRRTSPPPRGAHHHRHLLAAARAIGMALAATRRHLRAADDAGVDAILAPLRAGYQELQWAANALPGFEVVAFSQGCCARHAAPPADSVRTIA
jgi:hypothetical protein